MMESLGIGEMHGIMLSESIKLDESRVLDNCSIKKQEEELNELDNLISEIEKKKGEKIQRN